MYDEFYSDSNISVLIPNYLDNDVLRSASDESSEFEESEDTLDSEETSIDYSFALVDVNTSLNEIKVQIDTLNENVVTLNDNLIFCCGLLCAVVFFFVIKLGWYILNNILGLGKA